MRRQTSFAAVRRRALFFCLLLYLGLPVPGGQAAARDVVFRESPRDLQLFPRDSSDSADVVFDGTVTSPGSDSVRLEVYREGQLIGTDRAMLSYQGDTASFRLSSPIRAELSEYTARFYLDGSVVAIRDSLVCGDVYLINGQSNAVADDMYGVATGRSEWFRSFGSSDNVADACRADTAWSLAQGLFSYAHAGVGCLGLAFGLALTGTDHVPVAVLNGAVSGTHVVAHLRNEANPTDLSTIYGRLLWRCSKAGVRSHVRAIIWHQGESDTYTEPVPSYDGLFTTLFDTWHQDYGQLEKVYAFQIHPGCGGAYQQQMREYQRSLPRRFHDLSVMSTVGLRGHDGCHYDYDGYDQMARWLLGILRADLYGSQDTWNIKPPDVQAAWFNPGHDEVRLLFDSEVRWPADTLNAAMEDYFYVSGHGENAQIVSGQVVEDGRTVSLRLASPAWQADLVTYLPGGFYEGPWIRNPRGIGALSFWSFPIREVSEVRGTPREPGTQPAVTRLLGGAPNPFAGETRIRFFSGLAGPVRLQIFDAEGKLIRTLVDRTLPAGNQVAWWDGVDQGGHRAPAGVYWCRIQARDGASTSGITLVR